MCDKVILENGEMLRFVPDCYKSFKKCGKAVDNYFCIRICTLLLLD